MQELRLVLIIVGALAIAALLIHGLWTSKKEGKSKFAEKPIVDSDSSEASLAVSDDDFDVIKKEKSGSAFDVDRQFSHDPLGVDDPLESSEFEDDGFDAVANKEDMDLPHVMLSNDIDDPFENKVIFSDGEDEIILKPTRASVGKKQPSDASQSKEPTLSAELSSIELPEDELSVAEEEAEQDDAVQVIVINVHCAGDEPFVGTKLFDSMQQNGLLYGDMDIFHRHNDISGTGKVLFSVANMMHPGTLKHDDPATFTTKGISFFMTLPGFGEADQNFKVMLRTAQQIADDLGGNVLDEQRNLITPDKLTSFKDQIRTFKARNAQ